MLFSYALFLALTFPKIVKKSIFPLDFPQKFFLIFLKNFQTICGFGPNAGCVKFCVKDAKIMRFGTFLEKSFPHFRKFSGVRGSPPPDPPLGRLPKMFLLRNKILSTPPCVEDAHFIPVLQYLLGPKNCTSLPASKDWHESDFCLEYGNKYSRWNKTNLCRIFRLRGPSNVWPIFHGRNKILLLGRALIFWGLFKNIH